MRLKNIIITVFALLFVSVLHAQNDKKQPVSPAVVDSIVMIQADTTITPKDTTVGKDTLIKKMHDPRKATLRSAIIPGWGQAYNREYWKIPLVYAALGITGGTFVYNNKWYQRTKKAYDIVINKDTGSYDQIDPKLQSLVNDPTSLQYYRNDFRKNRDYSVLFFLLAWGLNVVDATVFGHLKDFDVSDDLSMHVKPTFDLQTKTPGLGLALNFKTPTHRTLPSF